ncbi:MAG: low molecular weight phosphotyrosine protein phosphatase [Bdellovibrionales bacterium]|nr:low molecular weight phosphotyrosine protein phosphatase [Bdellovibrionales bacterium]
MGESRKRPPKILFVCLGNICRSPMAEGIFRDLLRTQGLQGEFLHDRCGTGSWHAGSEPDRRAQAGLLGHGIDVSDLRARQLTESDFREFDLILAMDESNYEGCLSLAPDAEARRRVKKMLSYHGDPKMKDVPDPYHGGSQGFESVYDMLNISCRNLLKELLQEKNK